MNRLSSSVKLTLAGCLIAAFGAMPAAASIVRDFESDTVGQPLAGTAYAVVPTDTSLEIVSKEFAGGPTSKAVRIHDASTSGSPRFGLRSYDEDGNREGITKGTLSLTFESTPGAELRITLGSSYQAGSALYVGFSERAFMLTITPGGRIGNIGGGSSEAPSLDRLETEANTKYQLEIQFDTEADVKTWSGTLNGVAITSGGSASIPFNSNAVSAIHILEVSTGGTGDSFIDNIALIVPEPASAALLGLGTLLIARRARASVVR